MGKVVIRCLGMAGFSVRNGQDAPVGALLKSYDPEAHDGMGEAEWTNNPDEAITFDNGVEAHAFWTQVPKSRPRRPDGAPNRPLTAFSVEIGLLGALDES